MVNEETFTARDSRSIRLEFPLTTVARDFRSAAQPRPSPAPMRCYFNLVNGTEEIIDDDGIEVSGIEQARVQALKAIAELRQEDNDLASEWRNWRLEVSDSEGHVLFTISLAIDLH
jgi:hypothetical protein